MTPTDEKIRFNAALNSAYSGEVGAMTVILEQNPDRLMGKDDKGRTILHIAVSGRSNYGVRVVEELIERASKNEETLKKLLNSQDNEGWTPLHRAVLFNSLSTPLIIRLLLQKGADASIKDNHNDTALDMAEIRYEKGNPTYGTLMKIFREFAKPKNKEDEKKEEKVIKIKLRPNPNRTRRTRINQTISTVPEKTAEEVTDLNIKANKILMYLNELEPL